MEIDIELLRQKAREGTLTEEDTLLAIQYLRGSREMAQAPAAKRAPKTQVDVSSILSQLKDS